jgi:hypothetical protein
VFLAPDSPSITVKDGNVEVKVARREADVKFYRYARDKDVSIFDLDDKVNAMESVVAAAVVTAGEAQDAAVKGLGAMNAEFVTNMAGQVSKISSDVDVQMAAAQTDLDAKSKDIVEKSDAALVATKKVRCVVQGLILRSTLEDATFLPTCV